MLSRRYQILLIIATVLGIYYPSIWGEFNSLDDVSIVSAFSNFDHYGLKDIFFPAAGWSTYYRPLINLSFFLDMKLWFFSESFMHLENILLHTTNALLVYFLTVQLLSDSDKPNSYLPLAAAVCFGLHPLNTESVNWIAARTDVIACFFVLLSVSMLFKFKEKHKVRFVIASLIFLLFGVLSKEVVLALVPGFLLILTATKRSQPAMSVAPSTLAGRRFAYVFPLALTIAAVWLFVEIKAHYLTYFSYKNKIGLSLMFIFSDLGHALFVFLRAFGFYLKKLFLPWPLNFAILEVDPLYELLAIPLVALFVYISARRNFVSATFTAGLLLITPVFLIAYNQIAWTPYAERYMYAPSALIIPAVIVYAGSRAIDVSWVKSLKFGLTIALVLVISATTLRRNMTWMSNLTLYKDTVEKSPDFDKVRNEYGVALIKKGNYAEARVQLLKAKQLCSFEYDPNPDINLAYILNMEGKHDEALKVYKEIEIKTKGKNPSAYIALIAYYDIMMTREKDHRKVREMQKDMASCYQKLYLLDKNPHDLYMLGFLMNVMDDKERSLKYYREAYDKFPERNEFKDHAKKIIMRLEKE